MHLGVDDVLCLPQSAQSLGMAAAKARASRARRAAALSAHTLPSASRLGRDAHVFTVFSTKGGSGKTVIATNLAVCFGRQGLRTLLIDLDLHSGDDALVLGLSPRWTVLDLVQSPGDLDAEKLAGFVTRHSSGVDLLPAPTRPDEEELVAIDRLEPLLEVARRSYDVVVIDTSSMFSPATLLAIDHTDTLVLVGASDVPDDQEPEDRARDARPARDEPARHAHPDEPLGRQGGARGSRRRADAAARDHLHAAVGQGHPGLRQPRPAGGRRQPQVPRRPLAPGDRAVAPRGRSGAASDARPASERSPGACGGPSRPPPRRMPARSRTTRSPRSGRPPRPRPSTSWARRSPRAKSARRSSTSRCTKAIDAALAEAGTPLQLDRPRAAGPRDHPQHPRATGRSSRSWPTPEVTEVMVNNHPRSTSSARA